MALPFKGEKLREARRYRQLSITELGEKIGVSKQMVSKYERNESQPSPENYQKIVLNLGFPLKFYQLENRFEYKDNGTFYRSRLSSTQSEKKPSELLKKYLALLSNYFEEFVDFPILESYEFSNNPVIAAEELREFWGIGLSPIHNIMGLIEGKGFKVASIDSSTEKVDAFGSYTKINDSDYYCILIDQDNNSFFRQQFSLAHELAHWVLHSDSVQPQELDVQEYKEMENEANIFASNFLLPEKPFVEDIRKNRNDIDAYLSIKNKWNVSVASMVYRAKDLGIIDSKEFLSLQKKMSGRGWRKVEPFDSINPASEPILLKQAYELLVEAKVIGDSTIQNQLEVKYGVSLPNEIISELLNVPRETLSHFTNNNIVQMK